MLEEVLTKKTSIIDFEVTYNFPASGERILLLNASPINKSNTGEQSLLLAIGDITEKRKLDNELKLFAERLEKLVFERTLSLQAANVDLRHSNENLEQFAYIASHDLQEPLRKIKTYSSFLYDDYKENLPQGAQELIKKIISSSERMSKLIKALLNFSTVLHDEFVFEQTNLNDILNKALNDFELVITEKNAVIHHEPLPVIEAIPSQISQLFYNLISNSLKFSKKDIAPEITITVKMLTLKEIEKHKNLNQKIPYCKIFFKDNGIGLEQQFSDKIFLIFHRLNSREHFTGTGIGLALCKTIMINHHGEIYVTSEKNEGATFTVIMPLTQLRGEGVTT